MSSPTAPFPFPIVVLGDSIQWGQGLRAGGAGVAPDKMAELVGLALAKNPIVVGAWTAGAGLSISVSRFAHSGATINLALASPPGTITATVTATTAFPAGELPASSPTILDQVAGAPAVLLATAPPIKPKSDVFLVILDGGINDVGLFTTILNPFVSAATVSATANAACGGALTVPGAAALAPVGATTGQMSALLAAVGAAFPGAVIVVTGYYDIISAASDLTALVLTIGILTGSVVPGILDPGAWLQSVLAGSTSGAVAQAVVSGNCAAFTAASNAALASAVGIASAAPGGSFIAGSLTAPRFIFVPSPFTPVNALFTGGSNGADEAALTAPAFLWGFNPSLAVIGAIIDSSVGIGAALGGILGFLSGTDIFGAAAGSTLGSLAGAGAAIAAILPALRPVDEVTAARVAPAGVCAVAPPGLLGTGLIPCNLASVGHPNIEGDAAYAAAIAAPLITMFGTTLPGLGIVAIAKSLSSLPNCMIVTAAMGSPAAAKVAALQQLRDDFIAHSRLGSEFFGAASREYYAFSPIIAARMHSSILFKERMRSFAVSPFLGFVELLRSWLSEFGSGEFPGRLLDTLDASLQDLSDAGIAASQIAVAAAQISRLSIHSAVARAGDDETDIRGNDINDVVDYFNAVVNRQIATDGTYLDLGVLQPLKLYWRLLSARAASTAAADLQNELAAGMGHWVQNVAVFASRLGISADNLHADLQLLCGMLGASQSAGDAFAASLATSDDGTTRTSAGAAA